jgi:membrane associated rhomboid family serine protease
MVRYHEALDGMSPLDVELVLSRGFDALREGKNFVNPQLAHLNVVLNSTTVGASGAIYAILLGFGMLFPEERMFVFPIPFPIKAKYFVMGYVVIELYLGVSGSADGVAHFAHLGGMLFGFILILFWRNKGKIRGPYV